LRGKEFASYNTVEINEEYIKNYLRSANGKQRILAEYENTCKVIN